MRRAALRWTAAIRKRGGSRVDLGVMHLTDEVWPSDNTDAFDRLLIQNGFTTLRIMSA